MKKLFALFILTFLFFSSHSQSIGIGTNLPNSNAILDVASGSKGMLIPRMTQTQRDAMLNPPSGMILYMNGTNDVQNHPIGFYYRGSGLWKYIMSNADIDKSWQKITGGQYSLLENVGIGNTAPTAPLHIRKAGSFPLVRLDGGLPSIYFSVGNEQDGYSNTGRIYGRGNDLVISGALGSNDKRIVFQVSGEDKAMFEPDGTLKTKAEIRLTDAAFTEKGFVQMNGNDLRIGTVSSNNTGNFIVRNNGADMLTIGAAGDMIPAGNIQFKEGTAEKAFIQRNGDDLRFGTNSSNALGNVIVRMDGNDRFKFEKSGRLTLQADATPTLYFATGGTNQAFLQLQGQDLRISATGNKVKLSDVLTVDDASNRVGIGTVDPEQKLHVQGTVKISTGQVLNNSNENILPLGFAVFDGSGNKLSGTGNLTGSWSGTNFLLTCSGENINNTAVSITCRNARLMPSFSNASSGRVQINFFDDGGDAYVAGFSVVIYKTN